MFKELESAAIWGLAAGAASSWASRQMQPDSQRPVWQGELNGVVLTVVETNHHGYLGYEVSVIADGWCWSVGRFRPTRKLWPWCRRGIYTCNAAARCARGWIITGPATHLRR